MYYLKVSMKFRTLMIDEPTMGLFGYSQYIWIG
jgi:hypothetical protein